MTTAQATSSGVADEKTTPLTLEFSFEVAALSPRSISGVPANAEALVGFKLLLRNHSSIPLPIEELTISVTPRSVSVIAADEQHISRMGRAGFLRRSNFRIEAEHTDQISFTLIVPAEVESFSLKSSARCQSGARVTASAGSRAEKPRSAHN